MNIGKLVRQKMKQLRVDCSGEYVDNAGRHFTMKCLNDGYTVSYGGDSKREVDISKEQAIKLAGACRKLELAEAKEEKELSAKKRLAKSTQDILKIANQVESAGAGTFDRAGKDMNIWFRGDSASANENARRVAKAIGPQAGEPVNDRISGKVVLKVKNVY